MTQPQTPPRPAAPPNRGAPPVLTRARRSRRPLLLGAGLTLLLLVLAVAWRLSAPAASPAEAPPATAAAPKITARGQVRPLAAARVGTLTGGVVVELPVGVGDAVRGQQAVARVRSGGGAEVLTAPWEGTVTGIPVHLGDTVTPGAVIVTVGDLRGLQVETTDVDEFIIRHIVRGQPVTVTVDALDDQEYSGFVSAVSFELQRSAEGDLHYPVTIALAGTAPDLRPGMTVRITFPEAPPAE